MVNPKELETLFKKHGFLDFRWIDPKKIVISQWVRMKCVYGCSEYGRTATCPPNVPPVSECERFFQEYREAVIFHFAKTVPKPGDRHAWTQTVNNKLLEVERAVFVSGFERAFLLFMDSCSICDACPGKKEKCKEPKLSRPSPEALGIDVYSTVRQVGYPIQVLSDYPQAMNRYAFLMIE